MKIKALKAVWKNFLTAPFTALLIFGFHFVFTLAFAIFKFFGI